MKPRYTIEPTPITITTTPNNGRKTDFNTLDCRIIDHYTGIPIGAVLYGPDTTFHAHPFFPNSREQEQVPDEIAGDWGLRMYLAVDAIWRQYWNNFSWREKAPRILWRYNNVGWLVLGTILGTVAQLGRPQSAMTQPPRSARRAPSDGEPSRPSRRRWSRPDRSRSRLAIRSASTSKGDSRSDLVEQRRSGRRSVGSATQWVAAI